MAEPSSTDMPALITSALLQIGVLWRAAVDPADLPLLLLLWGSILALLLGLAASAVSLIGAARRNRAARRVTESSRLVTESSRQVAENRPARSRASALPEPSEVTMAEPGSTDTNRTAPRPSGLEVWFPPRAPSRAASKTGEADAAASMTEGADAAASMTEGADAAASMTEGADAATSTNEGAGTSGDDGATGSATATDTDNVAHSVDGVSGGQVGQEVPPLSEEPSLTAAGFREEHRGAFPGIVVGVVATIVLITLGGLLWPTNSTKIDPAAFLPAAAASPTPIMPSPTPTMPSPTATPTCHDDISGFLRAVRKVDPDGDELRGLNDAALVQLGHASLTNPSVLRKTLLAPFQYPRFIGAANQWLCH